MIVILRLTIRDNLSIVGNTLWLKNAMGILSAD